MRVLIVHNRYGQPSGEEAVVEAYHRLLRERGHATARFERSSEGLRTTLRGKWRAFWSGLGSRRSETALRSAIVAFRPDVVNVHNVYPLISPRALRACADAGVPVVMTAHNYRLVCPNGLLYTKGRPCERCVGGSPWQALWNRCEPGWGRRLGYAARTWVASRRGDFSRTVSLYLALTPFQRDVLVRGGVEPSRVRVVPNGGEAPRVGTARERRVFAYVGRLSEEKGVHDLLEAARRAPEVQLVVAGGGSARRSSFRQLPNVALVGHLGREDLERLRSEVRCIVYPSRLYEGHPMGILEAMFSGCPVIGPRLGAMADVIEDGRTGWHFRPHDVDDLTRVLREAWEQPGECERRGAAARAVATEKYGWAAWGARLEAALQEAMRMGSPT